MSQTVIGESVKGRPIECLKFGDGPVHILFIGGTHGDEPSSVTLIKKLIGKLKTTMPVPDDKTVAIVPCLNPDGLALRRRQNANGVDLNRNFPTKDWQEGSHDGRRAKGAKPLSEPETQALFTLMKEFAPKWIISVHSPYHMVNFDGPGEAIAKAMAQQNAYKVSPSIGYPTPGSLGVWAGVEQSIPVITLELPLDDDQKLWRDNEPAFKAAIDFVEPTSEK